MDNAYINKGLRIISDDGITRFFKKTLGFFAYNTFHMTTLIIFELDLEKDDKKMEPKIKLSFRMASKEDIDTLDKKRHNMSQKMKKYSRERLEKGDKCVLALYNKEVIGYSWAMKGSMELSQFNHIPIPEKKVYLYNAFVVNEFRGNRVNSAMRRYLTDNILKNEGKTTIIGTIAKNNIPSLKSAKRMGPKKVGKLIQLRILGLRYEYISKKDLQHLQTP